MTLEYLLKRRNDPAVGEIDIVHAAVEACAKPFRMTRATPALSRRQASGERYARIGYGVQTTCCRWPRQAISVSTAMVAAMGSTPITGIHPRALPRGRSTMACCWPKRFANSTFVGTSLSEQTGTQNVTAFAARTAGAS